MCSWPSRLEGQDAQRNHHICGFFDKPLDVVVAGWLQTKVLFNVDPWGLVRFAPLWSQREQGLNLRPLIPQDG